MDKRENINEEKGEKQTITPEIAMEILKTAEPKFPRKINESIVQEYAETMKAGQWHDSADPIVITSSGALINGAHRLLALIMANMPMSFNIKTLEGEE